MSEVQIEQHDIWLRDDGPAALVLTRVLLPVEGRDAWIFPPTFAKTDSADDMDEGNGGVYQIDRLLPSDPTRNVCVIDSVGSQANRIEPIFKNPPYSDLVPQVTVQFGPGGGTANLLDLGHRAADAAVRFSKKVGLQLWDAFSEYKAKRDCSRLVRIAPTSLVFGVWDSRATGVKIQRIARSAIRAYDVVEARRSATFQAATDYTGSGIIDEKYDKGSGKDNPLSQEGFKYSLATNTHGGVCVKGDIRQEAVINLVALRTLTDDKKTRRYLLGLALVALSYRDQRGFNLREGCLLCAASKEDYDGRWKIVQFDGTSEPATVAHDAALKYAKAVASQFGEMQNISDEFDSPTANWWLGVERKKRKALAKAKHPTKALAENAARASQQGGPGSEIGRPDEPNSGAAA